MSSRDMTLTQLKHTSKTFDDTHTIAVKGFKDGNGGPRKPRNTKPPKWFSDFVEEQRKFNKYVVEQFAKQEKFNQYVVDQFKKYGWLK